MSEAGTEKRMIRIGMLTPSSNTVLEPVTTAMLSELDDVSVHFARFRITAIGLDDVALAQFDDRAMLEAARLLADAKVDVIAWNGTSAGWLGLDKDRHLCERITAETGIAASTSVLSLFDIMQARGESRIGLVTPYTRDVQDQIINRFAAEGVEVVSEAHFGLRDNFSFATVRERDLVASIEKVAAAEPQAIAILCTNLAGASLVAAMEKRFPLAVHDSVATTVWGALRAAGIPTSRVSGYGALFENSVASANA